MSRFSLIFDADFPIPTGLIPFESIPAAAKRPRYNIGRNQDILVFCADTATTGLAPRMMRWGFTPHWVHDANPALQPLTIADRKVAQPYFRDAFRQRRCLIPATGFYAWQGWENGPAAPYHVRMRDRSLFLMAAIWDRCEGVDRVALITTEANALIRPIHDRMPAIIAPDAIAIWLHSERPQQALAPHAPGPMEIYPVSRRVFSLENDSADLLEPVAQTPPLRAHA